METGNVKLHPILRYDLIIFPVATGTQKGNEIFDPTRRARMEEKKKGKNKIIRSPYRKIERENTSSS